MKDIRTGLDLKMIPILEDEQVYIYAMLNTCNKIKIGITKNIQQRYQSLCGSNSQGNEILKVYVTEATYLNSLVDVGLLEFEKVGRESIYKNYRLIDLLKKY